MTKRKDHTRNSGELRCSAPTLCDKCERLKCKCGQVVTFYSIYSEFLGNGPLHIAKANAEQERDEMLQDYPDDAITIQETQMLAEAYSKLPEHEGY